MKTSPLGGLVILGLCALVAIPSAFCDYTPKGKRDPFVPLVTPEGQRIHPPGLDDSSPEGITGLTLQGIVFDPQAESYAIINGKIVRERDDMDGMKIIKIEPKSVSILVEGKPHTLSLRQTTDKENSTP